MKRFLIMLLMLGPSVTHATGCDTTVSQVGTNTGSGEVWMLPDDFGTPWYICSLNDYYNNGALMIAPAACQATKAILLEAIATGQKVHFDLEEEVTCERTIAWSALPQINFNLVP